MDKLVSIIVPIWNVEPYIRRCLDSIISQTYPHLEVILVDDGSPDNCGEICDEYARKDSRFKVIHQANQGVSVARQVGLDASTGYCFFYCDPDDYMESDMIECLVKEMEQSDADMVTCNFLYKDGTEVIQPYHNVKDLLDKMLRREIVYNLWQILFKRELIVKHHISFTPNWLSNAEDILFVSRSLVNATKVCHCNMGLYHYILRGKSLVNTRSKKSFYSNIAMISEVERLVSSDQFDNLFGWKRHVYIYAYESRYWKEMKNLYPEIKERLLKGKNDDRYSIDSQLARCIKYPPYLVWFEAKVYKYVMLLSQKIKQLMS